MEKTGTSIVVSSAGFGKIKDDALVIGFFKDKTGLSNELKKFDSDNGNIISECIRSSKFIGEKNSIKSIFLNKSIKNIVLVGLGEEEKYDLSVLSGIIADVSKRLRDNSTESFSIYMESFKYNKIDDGQLIEKISLSCLIGLYKFTEYKTKDKDKIKYIKQITIITNSNKNFQDELDYASSVAGAVSKTRDLVNTPPNVATPEFVANYARELARKSGLKCTIFDEKQISKMKMGCFSAVGKGSVNKPRLVVLEYNGGKGKPVAIVGKGVTFDSGGLNVKPYPYILNMKDDKGGAISAIHVLEACAKLKLPVNVMSITPLCENMIDANAYRPDDVLTAYNGMTIEIKNTDAEGRLILADALSYAAEMKPQSIFCLATLTGASTIVLGSVGTPFLSTEQKLSERLKAASEKSLEKIWELPD